MFIIGYFLLAVAKVLNFVLIIFMWLVIARAVLSWVSPDPFNPIVRFINNVTEPILYPIRSKLPVNLGGLDLSPIVVFMAIIFLQTFLVPILQRMAVGLI
ncbi:MAG: YggT family protein [Desulfosarcinaceae bacterium]|nr:YggT family protein [Desulfosarcinaceae bacterium]